MPKIRITNITSFKQSPGFGLDFMEKYISPNPNKPLIIDIPVIPQILEEWEANGWCRIQEADDKTPVTKPTEAVVTLGTKVNEANSDNLLDEEEIDFTNAKEAAMPIDDRAGPVPIQSIGQVTRAKVSLGMEERTSVADSVSPIPGDRPVSVDNSDQFTVRAPRTTGPGAVVRAP